MKKIISVLLAVLMIFSVMAVSASAEDGAMCRCGNHSDEKGVACYCCINCPTLEANHRFSCAKLSGDTYSTCCTKCPGYFGATYNVCTCNCGCDACGENASSSTDGSVIDKVVTEKDKQNFVDGFQAVLKKISDVFDRFFNAIFEFLRIDQILGNK